MHKVILISLFISLSMLSFKSYAIGSIPTSNCATDFYKNSIIIPTAEELINSNNLKCGTVVKTLGYYKENDGGGGFFIIQKTKPIKSETVLYYTLANGLYANCIDSEIVLPRYGGLYVNQMLDNARAYLRPGIRDVIVLPPSNMNHPGCSSYISGSGSRICFWQVNAPILFDNQCSYSEVFFHDEIVVAPEVDNIEAVLIIADSNKPEDITFVTPLLVEGRHMDVNNTIVAEHGVLIKDGARIIFGKMQVAFAKYCITLGGGTYSNEVEFYASNIEAGSCLERGLNIDDNKKSIRFNIDKMHLQAPIGKEVTWIYAHGNVTQSNIGTLFCSFARSNYLDAFYKVFDIETRIKANQVIDIDRLRISQCTEFGKISGGIYRIGSLVLTASTYSDINVELGKNTTIICDYLNLANQHGNFWGVTGADSTSKIYILNFSEAPKFINGGAVMSN